MSNERGNTDGRHQGQPPRAPSLRSGAFGALDRRPERPTITPRVGGNISDVTDVELIAERLRDVRDAQLTLAVVIELRGREDTDPASYFNPLDHVLQIFRPDLPNHRDLERDTETDAG